MDGTRLQVVTSGATAGLISRFIVAPLDVVKIRLQLQTHSLSDPLTHRDVRGGPIYKGTLPTIKQILANEGLTGLWKGNVPAELMYICYSAIQFSAYRSMAQLLQRTFGEGRIPQSAESFISGAAAGAAATATTYPLDLLRTRFAAQGNDRVYTSLRAAIVSISKDEGFRGFFRGLGPGLGQIVPFMGIFFSVYEMLRLPLAVFPLDLVRKRIQVQGPTRNRYVHKNIPEYNMGAVKTLTTILKTEGARGLYRGLTVSLIKAAPASAITVWTYERMLNLLISMDDKKERNSI
ncbi:putative mitochondrial deoxynucleotide carrier protein [Phaeoacremonium minimum UCRPA7]|uniref:Mitochondrial thiamine pyrophosphate carrier 1 n=1 Tax=Phaeoacremonium minimum (strain UCR-PA7) TaxID=1286976 RepID=R8BKE8_PHAM7|nr:putative mitochondrial deoxynucleotide carrier protein [Phaeoacremonium minimum UCRPA7]EON99687.1 putative mitochondrial deoxynucleotide carrier protein [Phaeoacremonium minimum UCRPA7]